jgi:N-acetylglucosaminyl-diphospho-decaprenol L-rhamnosyltransferase
VEIHVVIPTLNACDLLIGALESLDAQTVSCHVTVVDNASTDGTAAVISERFPRVRVVRNERNLGFGAAINRVALALDGDVLVLVNNDVVCEPEFVERLVAPLAEPGVGMAAGVLLIGSDPDRVDSAGIEFDTTLRGWDQLWNIPVERLLDARDPVGPCGGAAAYRLDLFREAGGFDESLFAYWEDIDLALRLGGAGWRCVLVRDARVVHLHGATLGAASPAQRRLEAFGRAYVLAKYGVARRGLRTRVAIATVDWPTLLVHLLVRREVGPLRERRRGTRAGLAQQPRRAPFELATVSVREALVRQWSLLGKRLRGELPGYLHEHAPARPTGKQGTPPSGLA